MPRYEVLLKVKGIRFPFEEDEAIGLFVNRMVYAQNVTGAHTKSVSVLQSETKFKKVVAVTRNQDSSLNPTIECEEISRVPFLTGMFGKPQGYVFFSNE